MAKEVREFVRTRATGRCEYCRLPEAVDEWPFHVEHIVSRQHGGDSEIENLCWACSRCNLNKGPNLGSIDPTSGDPVLLYHPRKQLWSEHFLMDDGRIVGITAIGRATARLLGMNSSSRIELRRRLGDLGEL
ncbi:HNH endonuclease [Lacipirellula limnantheis]|uniref:HNH endonuclease n=1 Tax=Lacipirellula limnantheis TaxID=2528024 RepID=A0A517TRZ4_9BACT|nr:HNH endonuclease [Lacipirellula limnantheis]